jgi:hypothetical protein
VHGPALFVCRHHVHGVGAFPVASVLAADRLVDEAGAGGEPFDVIVGTISACHGAVNMLAVSHQPSAISDQPHPTVGS